MSVVTDVVITCSVLEEDGDGVFPAIDFINEYLQSENKGILNHLNGHEGGYKAWQVDLFGGAFNYLDLRGFATALRKAPWVSPESVKILIQGEHDEIMQPVRLTPTSALNKEAEELQHLLYQHL